MATRQRQEPVSQTPADGSVLFEQSSQKASNEKGRHEQWERSIEEDWQRHLETLQQYICELLIKNQCLRMGLIAGDQPQRE